MSFSKKMAQKEQCFLPITLEDISLLENAKESRKSFLAEFGDEFGDSFKIPQLCVYFPSEIIHMKKSLEKKLKKLRKNPENPEKKDTTNDKEKIQEKKTNIIEKSEESNKNKTKLAPKKKSSSSSDNSESDKREENKKYSSNKLSKTKSSSGFSSEEKSKQQPIIKKPAPYKEDKILDSNEKDSDFLNHSIINDNKDDNTESDDDIFSFIEAPKNDNFPKDFEEKKKNKLIKTFKLSKEKYSYLNHPRNKYIREKIKQIVSKNNLKHTITNKVFVLEADNKSFKKNLEETYADLKMNIKKYLKFIKIEDMKGKDYHAFKKILHSGEYKEKFNNIYFLRVLYENDENPEHIIYYPSEKHEKKAIELKNFINERDVEKIKMLYTKYYDKNRKHIYIKKTKYFSLLQEEGKIVSEFFNAKTKKIQEELEEKEFLKNLDCQFVPVTSSKKDKEYLNSMVFSWKKDKKIKNSDDGDKLEVFLKNIKKSFYNERIFCKLFFKKPKNMMEIKKEKSPRFYFLKKETENNFTISFYGDQKEIFSSLEENKNEFEKCIKFCEKIKFLIKIIEYDSDHEFKEIKEKCEAIKKIEPYKKEENSQYVIIKFNKKLYDKILSDIKTILSWEKNKKNIILRTYDRKSSNENKYKKEPTKSIEIQKSKENKIVNKEKIEEILSHKSESGYDDDSDEVQRI